jgi:serine protease Do
MDTERFTRFVRLARFTQLTRFVRLAAAMSPELPRSSRACRTVVRVSGRGSVARFVFTLLAAVLGFGQTGWIHAEDSAVFTRAAAARRDIASDTSRKVVKIFGAGGLQRLYAYGSGMLVSPRGHIVTVWNHILDDATATVVLYDGRRFEAKIVGAEPTLDLAVLKIESEGLPYFNLGEATTAGPGTRVLAFSNAFKVAAGDEAVSVQRGVVAAVTRLTSRRGPSPDEYTGSVYIVDAVTNNSGAAGGALTNRNGALVGMIGNELRNAQSNTWVNYAIPITDLRPMIEDLIAGRASNRTGSRKPRTDPKRYRPSDFGLFLIPDVVQRTPAFVESVVAGSQAETAGLKPNDLIVFTGEELAASCKSVEAYFGERERGDVVRLVVRRDNALVTVEFLINQAPRVDPAIAADAADEESTGDEDEERPARNE